MPVLPPIEYMEPPAPPVGSGGIGSSRTRPTDYQIRHDALRLAVQAAAADKSILTPGVFSEWQTFFEQALRLAL